MEHCCLVATFDELREQAEQEIRGQGRSLSSDHFVGQAADLIAALRLWAAAQHRTEDDVREEVELADDTALKNIVPELREGGGDDALEASRRLEAIAYAPSERLSEIFGVAQTVFPPSTANEPLWPDEDQ
jgi:hypothetical protein